jgi:hypothetical protein
MLRKNKAIWISVAVVGFIVLAGAAGISIQANESIVAKHPNDRANHHPLHPNN